ncbi:hypothetical protein [Streptomyces sp. PSAA01]|uniref:hypothetical protein n=1 Tax=Streptomyces sp. PSAA01 TaxID=2912762 RepID=UPI001F202026|nr:hypothetical protein [Streptomyces sp. PSAA01]MCG0287281.1 hypothetical protein [Streptomyces sp. PSAA01]
MGAQSIGALMNPSDRIATPTRETRVMAFLNGHDLPGTPVGEPNLTVRELLIAVYRASTPCPAALLAGVGHQRTGVRSAVGNGDEPTRDRPRPPQRRTPILAHSRPRGEHDDMTTTAIAAPGSPPPTK